MLGRSAECALVDACLDRAREGRTDVTVIVGEPGVGKSEMCAYARNAADGGAPTGRAGATPMRVLYARGIEHEGAYPFVVLRDLLQPLTSLLDGLMPAARQALDALFELRSESTTDVYRVAAATLDLLARSAEEAPVAVVIDDAHWIDRPSADAVAFAVRRLEADAVAVVIATRPPVVVPWIDLGEVVTLNGLAPEAADELLRQVSAFPIAPRVIERVVNGTSGNPLALTELPSLLSPAQLAGLEPLPHPLPLGTRSEQAFARSIIVLPAACRRALAVVAAAGGDVEQAALPAMRRLGLDIVDLEPAERAGIVQMAVGVPVFRHPLVRSAALATTDPPALREIHRMLAISTGDTDPVRRAWHIAQSVVGPSEEAASTLDEAATMVERRTGTASAAELWVRAAGLSTAGRQRHSRLLRAANSLAWAGQSDRAVGLLDHLVVESDDDRLLAQGVLVRGQLAAWSSTPGRSMDSLAAVARRFGTDDPELAASALIELSMLGLSTGDVGLAVTSIEQLEPLRGQLSEEPAHNATVHVAFVGIIAGDYRAATALVDSAESLRDVDGWVGRAVAGTDDMSASVLADVVFCVTHAGRPDLASRFGASVLAATRATSSIAYLPLALTMLGEAAWWQGDLARAITEFDEAAEIAAELHHSALEGHMRALLARSLASAGQEVACTTQAAAAQTGQGRVNPLVTICADHATGLLALSRGRLDAAADDLDRAARLGSSIGYRSPTFVPYHADRIEAHTRIGNRDLAAHALADLETQIARDGPDWFGGTMLRCRGLLEPDAWEPLFVEAIDATPLWATIERARTQLCYGERLRRVRRHTDARAQLEAAAAAFRHAGAIGWADRAYAELSALGVRPRHRPATEVSLTPQELRICLAVGAGQTNREAAAGLYLSAKTVEHHLSNAYRKLGLTSRTQLARLVHDGTLSLAVDMPDEQG